MNFKLFMTTLQTWELVPRLSNTNVVKSKFVYCTKYKQYSSIDDFKALLDTESLTKVSRVNYNETFNLVVNEETCRNTKMKNGRKSILNQILYTVFIQCISHVRITTYLANPNNLTYELE